MEGFDGPENLPDDDHKKKLTGYAHLAKCISIKWKSVDKETAAKYADMAAKDKVRYNNEMDIYRKSKMQMDAGGSDED